MSRVCYTREIFTVRNGCCCEGMWKFFKTAGKMIWYNVGMAKYMENLVGCNGSCRWRLTIWVSFEALSGNLRKVEGIWGTCNDIINENLRIVRENFAAVLFSPTLAIMN